MALPPGPVFLARRGYRRRRLGDAARILPVLGAVLFMLPLLGGTARSTSGAAIWVFAVWAGLVVSAALLSIGLGRRSSAEDAQDPPR